MLLNCHLYRRDTHIKVYKTVVDSAPAWEAGAKPPKGGTPAVEAGARPRSPQIRVEPLMRPPSQCSSDYSTEERMSPTTNKLEIVSVAISGIPNRKASIFIFTTGL